MIGTLRYSSAYGAWRCIFGPTRLYSTRPTYASPTDEYGIPVRPTWSVHELLSSYPKPTISPSNLEKLHVLSALVPPQEGTPEHKRLVHEIQNLVKLVEAVKLVDTNQLGTTDTAHQNDIPDGRIWAEGTGIDLDRQDKSEVDREDGQMEPASGRYLLSKAARTSNGLYVVDSDGNRR